MGNTEKKAKEVLASLQVICPDKVWQDLSFELEQGRGASDAKWKNKISTPQALVLVLLIVTVSSFFLWKYLSGKQDTIVPNKTVTLPQTPKPVPEPVHKNIPPPVVKDTAIKAKPDSMHPQQNSPSEIASTPTAQASTNKLFVSDKQHQSLPPAQKQIPLTKRDSATKGNRHKLQPDSSVVKARTRKANRDSLNIGESMPVMRRDSIIVRSRDTAN